MTPRALYIAASAAAVALYLPGLGAGFVNYDDPATIIANPLIRDRSPAGLVRMVLPAELPGLPEYMPLKNLTYALDYALFGLWAPGWRVQHIAWYVAAVAAFGAWMSALFADPRFAARAGTSAAQGARVAAWATLLFAVHPAHVEAAAWLSGRKDLLAGVFMPLAARAALRATGPGGAIGVAAFTLLALLSKPTAIVLPLWIVGFDALRAPRGGVVAFLRERAAVYAAVTVPVVAFAAWYGARFGGAAASTALPPYRELVYAGPAALRVTAQVARFAIDAVFPAGLVPLPPSDMLPVGLTAAGWAHVGVAGMVAAALVYGFARAPVVGAAAWLFTASLAPVLANPVWGQYTQARYAFHAVAGPCLLIAWVAARVGARGVRAARFAPAAVAVAWAALTVEYRASWADSTALWARTAALYPDHRTALRLAGEAALEAGDAPRAAAWCTRARERKPDDPGAARCLAAALWTSADAARVPAVLTPALPYDVDGEAVRLLGVWLYTRGRVRESFALWRAFVADGRLPADTAETALKTALDGGDTALAARLLERLLNTRMGSLPPPVGPVAAYARAAGRAELQARAREAAEACVDTACFRARLALYAPVPAPEAVRDSPPDPLVGGP